MRRRIFFGCGALIAAAFAALIWALLAGGRPVAQPETRALAFYQQREEASDGFRAVIERFSQLHPDIDIQQQNVPSSLELLMARMQQRDVPDLFTHWPTQMSFAAAVRQGLVMELDALGMESRVSQEALRLSRQADGRLYALPLNHNCMEVYYNIDLFERAGVSVPRTADELFAACDRLAASGIQPMVAALRDGRMSHVAQACLAVLAPDYEGKLRALGAGTLDEAGLAQLRRAFDVFSGICEHSRMPDGEALTYYQACGQFARGEAAMFVSGSYALSPIMSYQGGQRISVFPLPGDDPGRQVILTGIDTAVCVAQDTAYSGEALLFLTFLMQPETAQLYAQYDEAPSCILGVEQQSEVTRAMREHIASRETASWLKSSFPLETVIEFDESVCQYAVTGDSAALFHALKKLFA